MQKRRTAAIGRRERMRRDVAEADHHRSVLRLSAAGRRIYEQVAPEGTAIGSRLLGAVYPGEHRQLIALLGKPEPWERAAFICSREMTAAEPPFT
jgi:hypothetical protein